MTIKLPQISVSTLFVIVPILYFNSCTAEFIKHETYVLPAVVAFSVMWLLVSLAEGRLFRKNKVKQLLPMGVYICILFVLLFLNMQNKIPVLYSNFLNVFFLLFMMCIFLAYSDSASKNDRIFIVTIWTADTAVSCIYSIYRLVENPYLSRYLSTGSFHQTVEATAARGIISFGGVYALVLVVLVLIYLFINNKNRGGCCGTLIVLFIGMIIRAQFLIAIILLTIGIVIVVFTKNLNNKNIFRRIMIMVSVSVPMIFLLPTLLDIISDSGLLGYAVVERLNEISMFLRGEQINNTDMFIRFLLYQMSISAFFSSYGMGALWFDSVKSGGHSEILDGLANYGVIYMIFIFALISFYKYILSTMRTKDAKHIYIIIFCIYIAMSFLNTSTWAQMMLALFVIIPFMCMAEVDDKENMGLR